MKRLLLFDVDGTLLDAAGAGRAALGTALIEVYGATGPIDDFPFDGMTDPAIVRALLRTAGLEDAGIDARFDELWKAYGARLEVELLDRAKDVSSRPGVPGLVEGLASDSRFDVGLLTGNIERGAWQKLSACGLAGWFAFGAFGSDAERRDELPAIAIERARAATGTSYEPREAIVIGDTPEDIGCAKAGGTRVLAVATGNFSEAELAGHGPDWVVASLKDHRALARLFEAP